MDCLQLGFLKLEADEALVVGDPCYFDDTPDGFRTVDLNWSAGNYPVFLATEDGQPVALILSRAPFHPPSPIDLEALTPDGFLGVDSGQMAMIAASILPTWTRNEDWDFDHPQSDYDHACRATLTAQLRADFLPNRSEKKNYLHASQVGTAVASSTRYGDGEYPLIVQRLGIEITAVVVLFGYDIDMND